MHQKLVDFLLRSFFETQCRSYKCVAVIKTMKLIYHCKFSICCNIAIGGPIRCKVTEYFQQIFDQTLMIGGSCY